MRYVNEKTFTDSGHAVRSVPAKTQGILDGVLEVDAALPYELAQGLFATPNRYPVVMRFSTLPETSWMIVCRRLAVGWPKALLVHFEQHVV